MDNPKVRIYTNSGKLIGQFDDEDIDSAFEIAKDHIRAGDVVVIADDLDGFYINRL